MDPFLLNIYHLPNSILTKLFLIIIFLTCGLTSSNTQTLAIKAGHIVDPLNKQVQQNQIILIDGKTIHSIVPEDQYQFPDSIPLVDLSEHYVLPGLMEAHTHICMALPPSKFGGDIRNYFSDFLNYTQTNSTAYRALVGMQTAKDYLEAGFTTIRDLGNAGNYADSEVRRAIEEGLMVGPTIINAGKIISPMGGQYISQMKPDLARWFDNETGDYVGVLTPDFQKLENVDYIFADSQEEMRKAIRQNILFGAKVIKIVVDDQPFSYDAADIQFIVSEAKKAHLKVAAHCITEVGARNAINGGVHSIEHGSGMTEQILQLAKEKGVFLVPAGGPLKKAYEMGVKVAFGADNIRASTPELSRTAAIFRYLDYYKNQEIPDADILTMMTTTPAEMMNFSKSRGQILPSFYADIIAVKENPLEEIKTLKEVEFVMKEGKVIKE